MPVYFSNSFSESLSFFFIQHNSASSTKKTDSRLRAMMRDLKEKGYLTARWADDVPYIIEFNEKAYALQSKKLEEEVVDMKSGLLKLIDQISDIKSCFHLTSGDGMPRMNVIYDTTEFCGMEKICSI